MTVAIQPDDKIVVAGSAYPEGAYHSAALLRVNSMAASTIISGLPERPSSIRAIKVT